MRRYADSLIAATAAELAIRDTNPKSKAILKKLEEPISMSFDDETPLEDVLKYIKQATTSQDLLRASRSTSIPRVSRRPRSP